MIDIETVDSENILVCKSGVLLSVIEILGCGSVVGNEEFADRVEALTRILSTRLSPGSGHSIKIIYESDPDNIVDDLSRRMAGAKVQAKKMKLEIDDIIEEKILENAKFCQREKLWLCFYTSRNILNKSDQSENEKRLRKSRAAIPNEGASQNLVS